MDMEEAEADLETAREIGSRVGVSADTIRLWARQGWIPALRITPKVLRFSWSAVLLALRERGLTHDAGLRR